jgi:hypothetical protein
MGSLYNNLTYHELSGSGSVSRSISFFVAIALVTPLCGCATVSVYQASSAEVSLTQEQSQLQKAADAYCKDARQKGLATGEASLGNLADMLTGKAAASAYWKRIGADRSAPAGVVSRVRADMNDSAKGLLSLDTMAKSLLASAKTKPGKDDVTEFELALIHARQARDSFSDALLQVNKRTDREYQVADELTPLDNALTKARATADELAAAREMEKTT